MLFFRKRNFGSKLITFYYAAGLAFIIADAAIIQAYGLSNSNDMFKQIFSSFLGVAIWVPYVNMSKRVKQTFVNRLGKAQEIELAPAAGTLEQEVPA